MRNHFPKLLIFTLLLTMFSAPKVGAAATETKSEPKTQSETAKPAAEKTVSKPTPTATKAESKTPIKTEKETTKQEQNKTDQTKQDQAKGEKVNPQVVIETSEGKIELELFAKEAPISTENFLKYVDKGFYDGTIFHRVIPGFMIQGGGMNAEMKEKQTEKPIKNEAGNGQPNLRGTLAMARTNVVDSATAQFFINVKDNSFLDHKNETPSGFGYAVFGKVISGMDVVDKITAVKTGNKGFHQDVPVTPIVIKSAKRK